MTFRLVAFAVAASALTLAQGAPQFLRLYEYDVPAGAAAEFFDVQEDTAAIYKANKSPVTRMAWTSMTGEGKFYMVVPLTNLSQLSEPTWLSKQGEERERAARQSRLAKTGAAAAVHLLTPQQEASWFSSSAEATPEFMVLSVYSVKPGKVADFLVMMKEQGAVVKKMGKAKNYLLSRVSFGGDGYRFYLRTDYGALGDIGAQAEFRAAMGEAAYASYVQKLGATVSTMEREILRYRPAYSHIPSN